MATLTKGYTFGASELVTNAKLASLVDDGSVTGIVNADIDNAAAIADSKLATISTASKVDTNALFNASLATGDIMYYNGSKLERLAVGSVDEILTQGTTVPKWAAAAESSQDGTINFIIDGGGAAVATGVMGDVQIDFKCTITSVEMLADQSGSMVVDIWKDTYANFPPTNADTITATATPTISAATKSSDSTLTGWTTSIATGDILRYNVDSNSTIERATVALNYTR